MKKTISAILALLMLITAMPMALATGTKADTVVVKTKTVTLAINETAQIFLSQSPTEGVTWSSSDESIVTVAADGKVTGRGYGTAIVTATSKASDDSDYAVVTVDSETVFYHDFDDNYSGWFTEDYDGDGYTWMMASDYDEPVQTLGYDAVLCASYFPNSGDRLNSNDYLISQSFDIPADAKSAKLNFVAGALNPGIEEQLFVFVGVDIGGMTDLLQSNYVKYNINTDYDQYTLDLSDFIGEKDVMIAFNYDNDDTYGVWLDNVGLNLEYNKIDTIKITDADLDIKAGDKAGDHLDSMLETANCTVYNSFWWNVTDDCKMGDDELFEADKEYQLGFWLRSDTGYRFAVNPQITVNGSNEIYERDTFIDYSGYQFYVWTAGIKLTDSSDATPISVVSIDEVIIVPEEGKTAGESAVYAYSTDQHITVERAYWYNVDKDVAMGSNEVFEKGVTYSMFIEVLPETGYKFTDDTVVLVNDDENNVNWEYSYIESDKLGIWTPDAVCGEGVVEQKVIDKVDIIKVNTTPVLGEKAGDHLSYELPEGAHYTVQDVFWYDLKTGGMEDSDVFVEGAEYQIVFSIIPDMEYVFTENAVLTINGGEVDEKSYVGEGGAHCMIGSVPAKAQEAADEVLIGDANGDGTINTSDAVTVLKYAAEMITLEGDRLVAANTNKDDKVNTADAVLILKYAADMIHEF